LLSGAAAAGSLFSGLADSQLVAVIDPGGADVAESSSLSYVDVRVIALPLLAADSAGGFLSTLLDLLAASDCLRAPAALTDLIPAPTDAAADFDAAAGTDD